MNVVDSTIEETHYYRRGIELEGAEPQDVRGYTHQGKKFLPDYAYARWEHGEPVKRISLRGHVLKKDGTPGKDRTDVSYETPASKLCGVGGYPSAPQWLLELFADSPHTAKEG
jgi:hypothetical protein